ncbi:MAG TPA: transporter [Pseudomonadales bacterium]|nr:transporter [Pseudomonadales bacterium]
MTGADFNEVNSDTDYDSGTQFHVDGTLGKDMRDRKCVIV